MCYYTLHSSYCDYVFTGLKVCYLQYEGCIQCKQACQIGQVKEKNAELACLLQ